MKALSITEPYASLIAQYVKHVETRSWRTSYRGPLLIHASATRIPKAWRDNEALMSLLQGDTHRGEILCTCRLTDCVEMTDEYISSLPDVERTCGFYEKGRYAWVLEDVQPLTDPIPMKGRLGVWEAGDVI